MPVTGKKLKIALLCGGISPEHEVSLSSGKTCALALDSDKYDLLPVCIKKDGTWMIPEDYLGENRIMSDVLAYFDIYEADQDEPVDGLQYVAVEKALYALKQYTPDVVFILLHGKGGEDGVIQGFLEYGGFLYTGPGVLPSALGMDKIRCLKLMSTRNYKVPPFVFRLEIPDHPDFCDLIRVAEKKFGYPCFVKPARVGSSVGMSKVQNRSELENALNQARLYDSQILVEEFIEGTEVTCGVLDQVAPEGGATRIVLPPTEIVVRNAEFFDYESKYTPGMTDEITPARLPESILARIQETAKAVHQLIGCTGMSRIDMIVRDREIYLLECNTIPGMTPTSLLPQGAAAAGISFSSLLDIIIGHACYAPKYFTVPE